MKKMVLVLTLAITLLLVWPFVMYVRNETSPVRSAVSQDRLPWLLESGLVESTQAEVRLIVWFDGDQIPLALRPEFAQEEWEWNTKIKETMGGMQAVTVTGRRLVTRDEESAINNWYAEFASKVKQSGGRFYLDERVSGVVDPAAYLASVQAQPRQWILSERTSSIAAYRADGSQTVQAGPDRINVQVLTRSGTGTGQSVLALPVLLEEF